MLPATNGGLEITDPDAVPGIIFGAKLAIDDAEFERVGLAGLIPVTVAVAAGPGGSKLVSAEFDGAR